MYTYIHFQRGSGHSFPTANTACPPHVPPPATVPLHTKIPSQVAQSWHEELFLRSWTRSLLSSPPPFPPRNKPGTRLIPHLIHLTPCLIVFYLFVFSFYRLYVWRIHHFEEEEEVLLLLLHISPQPFHPRLPSQDGNVRPWHLPEKGDGEKSPLAPSVGCKEKLIGIREDVILLFFLVSSCVEYLFINIFWQDILFQYI